MAARGYSGRYVRLCRPAGCGRQTCDRPWFQVESVEDQVRHRLLLVHRGDAAQLDEKDKSELKKRKLLSEV